MDSRDILNAVGEISDEALERGEAARPRRGIVTAKVLAAAAAAIAVCACVGIAGANIGGNDSGGYMSYEGPVFPLSTLDSDDRIAAERELTFDFSSSLNGYVGDCAVSDRYTLVNTSDDEIKATLIYPITGTLIEPRLPAVTVDGLKVKPELACGMYIGSFADENGNAGDKILESIENWEGYRELLSNGGYRDAAFSDYRVPDMPVAVYRITDVSVERGDAVAPSLQFETIIDYDKTLVLTYGFSGGVYDRENGLAYRSAWVDDNRDAIYLAVLGDDIDGYKINFYRDGGCDEDERISGNASVVRYETTLGDFLREVCGEYREAISANGNSEALYANDPELLFGEVCRYFERYDPADRSAYAMYDDGSLEGILSDCVNLKRVLYLSLDVTLEPHGSAVFEAVGERWGSFDYYHSGSGRNGVYGYDTVTALGSELSFSGQSVRLVLADGIQLESDEFGFEIDPETGVGTAEIPLDAEHRAFEIKRTGE